MGLRIGSGSGTCRSAGVGKGVGTAFGSLACRDGRSRLSSFEG